MFSTNAKNSFISISFDFYDEIMKCFLIFVFKKIKCANGNCATV